MERTFEKVKSFISRHSMLSGARGVVVAVSSGPDSIALLDILLRLNLELRQEKSDERKSSGRGWIIHVAHFDHMLRAEASRADAAFVFSLAKSLGVPATIGEGNVRAEARRSRRGIEDIARIMRYGFLSETALHIDADRIAVGHTMNDQAETFLMHLARGAGTGGLSGMRPVTDAAQLTRRGSSSGESSEDAELVSASVRPLVIRPLLCITRDEVEEYCRDRKLEFRMDETNLIRSYTRNRIRLDVIPQLRKVNPRIVEAISRAASLCAADEEVLAELAARRFENALKRPRTGFEIQLSVSSLLAEPPALRTRIIIEAMEIAGRGNAVIDATGLSAIDDLIEGRSGKRVELKGRLVVWREFDYLVFSLRRDIEFEPVEIDFDRTRVEAGGFEIKLTRRLPSEQLNQLLEEAREEHRKTGRDWMIALLDDDLLSDRLTVRHREAGERALVLGSRSPKKLKKLMIDHRIPTSRRRFWPVVATSEGEYVWSPGLPPSAEFAARSESVGIAVLRASDTSDR